MLFTPWLHGCIAISRPSKTPWVLDSAPADSRGVCALLVIAAALMLAACNTVPTPSGHPTAVIGLPGNNSRFDYATIDSSRGLMFIAHLGASEVIEVDVHANRVVRAIPALAQVHGVLAVAPLNRVFATATGDNQIVAIDETSGQVVGRAPTGDYPDGIAYDSRRNAIWTTNERAGTETVVDAGDLHPLGTVDAGSEVGNVGYDPVADLMLVAVQGANDLAVIDPASMKVGDRITLPGCDHPHGLAIDSTDRLAFVACDHNDTLLTVDLTTRTVTAATTVGQNPDVLAYDPGAHRLVVAAESGIVATFDLQGQTLTGAGPEFLAEDAHVVAVDPATHRSYYPIPHDRDGHPAVLIAESHQ